MTCTRLCTLDKSLFTRYQKYTAMFNWSPRRGFLFSLWDCVRICVCKVNGPSLILISNHTDLAIHVHCTMYNVHTTQTICTLGCAWCFCLLLFALISVVMKKYPNPMEPERVSPLFFRIGSSSIVHFCDTVCMYNNHMYVFIVSHFTRYTFCRFIYET